MHRLILAAVSILVVAFSLKAGAQLGYDDITTKQERTQRALSNQDENIKERERIERLVIPIPELLPDALRLAESSIEQFKTLGSQVAPDRDIDSMKKKLQALIAQLVKKPCDPKSISVTFTELRTVLDQGPPFLYDLSSVGEVSDRTSVQPLMELHRLCS